MRPILLKKIPEKSEDNYIGYETIEIIDRWVSRVGHINNMPWGGNFIDGDFYEQEWLTIVDGKCPCRFNDEDIENIFECYEVVS